MSGHRGPVAEWRLWRLLLWLSAASVAGIAIGLGLAASGWGDR